MSKPKPPAPPDPTQVASAQTGTNIGTAIANTQMGQVNQVTPEGSLMYSQTGTQTYTDPTTGRTYAIPQYTATTSLSPEAQAIREQTNRGNLNMATLAANQSGRADELLSTPFSLDSVPGGADRSGMRPVDYNPGLNAPQFSQGAAPLPQASTAGQMPGLSSAAMVPGASQGTVGPQFGQVGTNANLQDSYTPEGGFSADRQRVEDALMGRLGTQRERDMEALRTQLTNQGVNIGTEAYSRALQDFERTNTDMRTNAILASGQEQSRLLGEARGAAGFTNEARQAGFQNQLAGTGFNNAANLQSYQLAEDQRRYADAMGLQRFGMGEDIRRYGDAQGLQRFGMGEDIRRYDDAQRLGLFGMGEDVRRYGDTMGQQGFMNQQAIQGRDDALRSTQFAQQQSIMDAQDNARARAMQEQLALRNQPINEITALLSGSQVATPQFGIAQSAMIPTTDYAGIQQQGFNNQQANYQQRNANYQELMGGLFGMGKAAITASDIRLKDDIEPAGERNGHNWYKFRYVWDEPGTVREGVMAQEVMQTHPEAVITHPLGFYMVNYEALGV
jgi:hypothetical protein